MRYLIILALILTAGCNPFYKKNGVSIWGYSREKEDKVFHAGFISTDLFFQNSDNSSQTTKEKIKIEKQLEEELGFGTIGLYGSKGF